LRRPRTDRGLGRPDVTRPTTGRLHCGSRSLNGSTLNPGSPGRQPAGSIAATWRKRGTAGRGRCHPADNRPAPLRRPDGSNLQSGTGVTRPTTGRLHCGGAATILVVNHALRHPADNRPAPLRPRRDERPAAEVGRSPGRQPAGSIAAGSARTTA